MRSMRLLCNCALAGWLLLCLARPSVAGPPPAPAPPGLVAGVCSVFAVAAAASIVSDHRLAGLRARVDGLRSPQIHAIDPLRVHFSLHDLGEYEACQAELRALLAFEPVIARPLPKGAACADGLQAVSDHMFIRPVETRPVKVLDDRLEHWRQALTCDVNSVFGPKYVLPPACIQAIDQMLKLGDRLPAWRAGQLRKLRAIAKRAGRLTHSLKRSYGLGVAAAQLEAKVRRVNVVLLMLLCDVLEHPDVNLPRAYLRGFPVTGVIPDSHVLRPQPAADPEEEFWVRYHHTMSTNDRWSEQLARQVAERATSSRGKALGLLRTSWELTKTDISAGFCGKPMTLAQLRAKYGSGPRMACRPIQRHGIVQGQKQQRGPDGVLMFHPNGAPVNVDKIRLVDDSRRSLHNSHLIRTCETVAPCPFTYMAYVCDAVVLQSRGMNVPVPRVVFSTDDMRSAYRQVPTSDPEMCIVCIYSFDPGNTGPRFVENWGHNFGHTSSVSNYWRTPLLCCQAARHFLAIPVDHYCDDYATPDFALAGLPDCGAAAGLSGLHDALGLILEPAKHQPPNSSNVFLGVVCDVSSAHHASPFVEFRPSSGRTDRVMAMLDHASVEGLSAHSAQVIKGKLGWILQSAWGGVGRAAAQPLVSRTGTKNFLLPGGRPAPPETHLWTPELASMTQFFRTLFKFLPPLRRTLGATPRGRLLVYSDAQYSQRGRKGLGVVVTDTLTNTSYMCGGEVPDDILAWMDSFGSQKKQKINQCELLAVIAAVMTFGDILRDRELLVWVDNVPALSAAVHGYSHAPEMASLSNALHLLLAGLSAAPRFLHVPGKANPADIPSRVPFVRRDGSHALDPDRLAPADARVVAALRACYRPMVLPTAAQLGNLEYFIRRGAG